MVHRGHVAVTSVSADRRDNVLPPHSLPLCVLSTDNILDFSNCIIYSIKFHLQQLDTASSSRWHHPPGCTVQQSTPAGKEVCRKSPPVPDKAPRMHLNLKNIQLQQWFNKFNKLRISNFYLPHFCSRGKETSTRYPGRLYFLQQPGWTLSFCSTALSLPPSIACLLLHILCSTYPDSLDWTQSCPHTHIAVCPVLLHIYSYS